MRILLQLDMIVGYDSGSSHNIHGIGIYVNKLIKDFKRIDPDLELVGFEYSDFHNNMNIKERSIKFMMRNLFLSSGDPYWEWYKIPSLGKQKKIDIFHSTGSCAPRTNHFKTILTVHDLAYYHYPDYLSPRTIRFFKTWYRSSAKSADAIIAISENTKNDIIKFWKIPKKKIHVIHQGIPNHFFKRKESDIISSVLERYNIPKYYFLFVGELNYRKNVHTLIQSFKIFKKKDKKHKLVLVGKAQNEKYLNQINVLIRDLGLRKHVIMTKRVSNNELLCLYQAATAVVFPSLYEGFGLPILEAFASETPVISSNSSSIPEVAGDAGILVDPLDKKSIAIAMNKVLVDPAHINSLKRKGKARAKELTSMKTAEKTLELYKNILS